MALTYSDCERVRMQIFDKIKGRMIRLAVVGCGRISDNHFKAISNYPKDLELVAVCDINEDLSKNSPEI